MAKQSICIKIYSFIAVVFICSLSIGCSHKPAEYQNVRPEGNLIKIPLNEAGDGKVHFYTYKNKGKHINFFVRIDGKGNISAYFDACYTCYKKKKGYHFEGKDLICNECNMKFPVVDETWNMGSCNPIPLKSSLEEGFLVISVDSIERGSKLF